MYNIPFIIAVILAVITLVASWKYYVKAGKPGWSALVPIYNVYVSIKIAGKPGWWLILYFLPVVNLVIHFIVSISIAKTFGKKWPFGVGIVLLPFIFIPILGFGRAIYTDPSSGAVAN